MNKEILLFVLFVSVSTLSCTPGYYPVGYTHCIVACTQAKNAHCSTLIFPAIYLPRFCGLMPDGSWQNFSFECQACIAGAVAVDNGACDCEQVPCGSGFTCVDKECVPITDPCYPEVTSPAGCILSCDDPSFDNCPDTFIEIYNPSFCAWTTEGTWVNYTFACQACQNSQVLGILQGACSCNNIVCPAGQTCTDGTCIQTPHQCKQPRHCGENYDCIDNQCVKVTSPCGDCADGYFCLNGRCTDKCVFIRCTAGTICREGKCLPDGACTSNADCLSYELCLGGECVDRCATMRCPGPCQKGQCICYRNQHCLSGYICVDQQCVVDSCAAVTCPTGVPCVNGQCQFECNSNADCGQYEVCNVGTCIDICQILQCTPGLYCHQGECISQKPCSTNNDCFPSQTCQGGFCGDSCAAVTCPVGIPCLNGQCQYECQVNDDCEGSSYCLGGVCVEGSSCQHDFDCSYGKECSQKGFCVDRCDSVTCPSGVPCVDGVCQVSCITTADCGLYEDCNAGRCLDKCALIFCSPNQICHQGLCINRPQCTKDHHCQTGYKCLGLTCVDKCANVICPTNHPCVDGECKGCRDDFDCTPTEICNAGVCLDKCAVILCPPGHTCNNGQCIDLCSLIDCAPPGICVLGQCVVTPPPQQCQINSDCPVPTLCVDGQCVDLCENIVCPGNLPCIGGQCPIIEPICTSDLQCPPALSCVSGQCVDLCATVTCPPSQRCIKGQCESLCVFDQQCPFGYECKGGKCVDKCELIRCLVGPCVDGSCLSLCQYDGQCKVGEKCFEGFCYSKCHNVVCPQGSRCEDGICVQDVHVCPAPPIPPKPITCTHRPSLSECPVVTYIREPDYLFCGITNHGFKVAFARECEACQSLEIAFYWNVPCPTVPTRVCTGDEFCIGSQCVSPSSCNPVTEVFSPAGCINSCSDPRFDDCPDVFPLLYAPNFCAWTLEGEWRNYTFDCQACQNPSVIGVINGPCTCDVIGCLEGQVCINGDCFAEDGSCSADEDCPSINDACIDGKCVDKCIFAKCSVGYKCIGGNCVPINSITCQTNQQCEQYQECISGVCTASPTRPLDVCPEYTQYETKECINRPTIQQCPPIYYFTAPPPVFCGVTSTGVRKDYVRQCEVCLDEAVDYYFDVPCHFAPQVCQTGVESCSDYQCIKLCSSHDECRYNWQICSPLINAGQCTDRCTFLRCANCKFGICGYQEPSEACNLDSDCSNNAHSCISNLCVDLCITSERCPPGGTCWKGQCFIE